MSREMHISLKIYLNKIYKEYVYRSGMGKGNPSSTYIYLIHNLLKIL